MTFYQHTFWNLMSKMYVALVFQYSYNLLSFVAWTYIIVSELWLLYVCHSWNDPVVPLTCPCLTQNLFGSNPIDSNYFILICIGYLFVCTCKCKVIYYNKT